MIVSSEKKKKIPYCKSVDKMEGKLIIELFKRKPNEFRGTWATGNKLGNHSVWLQVQFQSCCEDKDGLKGKVRAAMRISFPAQMAELQQSI